MEFYVFSVKSEVSVTEVNDAVKEEIVYKIEIGAKVRNDELIIVLNFYFKIVQVRLAVS